MRTYFHCQLLTIEILIPPVNYELLVIWQFQIICEKCHLSDNYQIINGSVI